MAKERMDLLELLRKGGMDGDVDFLREALRVLVEGIMDAEVSSRIGAEYGERSPERVTQRNGYRSRAWDTRIGTMDLHFPKLREGSYFPSLRRVAKQDTFVKFEVTNGTARTYVDTTDIEPGTKYIYRVHAVDAAGLSEVSRVTVTALCVS